MLCQSYLLKLRHFKTILIVITSSFCNQKLRRERFIPLWMCGIPLSKIHTTQNLQVCRKQIKFQVLVEAFSVSSIRKLWNTRQGVLLNFYARSVVFHRLERQAAPLLQVDISEHESTLSPEPPVPMVRTSLGLSTTSYMEFEVSSSNQTHTPCPDTYLTCSISPPPLLGF